MLQFVANLDSEGHLVKLHFEPTEECNLDDAGDRQQVGAADAFTLVARDAATFGEIPNLLCGHCIRGEDAPG